MQAIANYRQGLSANIQRALIGNAYTTLDGIQQAAVDAEAHLSALVVNKRPSRDVSNMKCSRCGSANHHRRECKAKVHCEHCCGEGHNTEVCFKHNPEIAEHFKRATNSAASSPRSINSNPRPQPRPQQQHNGASNMAAYQQNHQSRSRSTYQPQNSTNPQRQSTKPIPPAPSTEYCHLHNSWTHGDTTCAAQNQQQQQQLPARNNGQAPPKKPYIPIAKIECYNCHQLGHYRVNCPKNVQTALCATIDHKIAHKPTICTYVADNDQQLTIDIPMIIDTGADINLIDSQVVKELGMEYYITPPHSAIGQLDGNELEISGSILLPISLGNPTVSNTAQWFSINNYGLNILGTPYLIQAEAVPDIANKRFYVNNYQQSVPLQINIKTASMINETSKDEVPGRDQIISADLPKYTHDVPTARTIPCLLYTSPSPRDS